jgi:ABC-type multidrug transport system ATPase subunit
MKIKAEKVTKKYGSRTIVRNFTAEWSAGVFGIAGSNGSGKSTLLRCLTYLIRPSNGEVTWYSTTEANEPLEQGDVRRRLGYVAPYIECYPELTGRENITFLAQARAMNLDSHKLDALFERLGILPRVNQPYSSLSTGQRQRIKLATALFHEPDVLVLDEPGSNLDKKGREVVETTVQEYKTQGKLVLVASNQQEELSWCDELISLDS